MKHGYLTQEYLEKELIMDMERHNPDQVFRKYCRRIKGLNLYAHRVECGAEFYRARKGFLKVPAADRLDAAVAYPYYGEQIGAPPPVRTEGGRFNRDGYSYLYLSSDRETCAAEIHLEVCQICSLAVFRCVKEGDYLRLLPDPNWQDEYELMMYRILTQPIHSEIQYKYRLTQLFSDIIKELGYRGIYFKSTQAGGFNVVCFYPEDFEYVPYSERMVTARQIRYTLEEVQESYGQYRDFQSRISSRGGGAEKSREAQIEEHIAGRQERDDRNRFQQLLADAQAEKRPAAKARKYNQLVAFAREVPRWSGEAYILRGSYLIQSEETQARAIGDLLDGFGPACPAAGGDAVQSVTEYICKEGLMPGLSRENIARRVSGIAEGRERRPGKKRRIRKESTAE